MKPVADRTGAEPPVPPGFVPVSPMSAFSEHAGPVYVRRGGDGLVHGFRVTPKHANLGGIAHGGMIATFADTILGRFEMRDYGQMTVTIRLLVDFIGPARIGDWVEGRSRIIRRTRSLVFSEGSIWTGRHAVATCSAVFRLLERPLLPPDVPLGLE